jgi:hypothetical protein
MEKTANEDRTAVSWAFTTALLLVSMLAAAVAVVLR